jgi:hypothetical protein
VMFLAESHCERVQSANAGGDVLRGHGCSCARDVPGLGERSRGCGWGGTLTAQFGAFVRRKQVQIPPDRASRDTRRQHARENTETVAPREGLPLNASIREGRSRRS